MLILLKWKLPAEVDAPAPAKTTVCLEEARRPQRYRTLSSNTWRERAETYFSGFFHASKW